MSLETYVFPPGRSLAVRSFQHPAVCGIESRLKQDQSAVTMGRKFCGDDRAPPWFRLRMRLSFLMILEEVMILLSAIGVSCRNGVIVYYEYIYLSSNVTTGAT